MAFELSSVLLSLNHARIVPQFGDAIEFAGDTQAGERRVHHQVQTFLGEVIYQRQDTEASTAHQRIGYEVERPAQITPLRDHHRCLGAESPLAATALAHGEPLLLGRPRDEALNSTYSHREAGPEGPQFYQKSSKTLRLGRLKVDDQDRKRSTMQETAGQDSLSDWLYRISDKIASGGNRPAAEFLCQAAAEARAVSEYLPQIISRTSEVSILADRLERIGHLLATHGNRPIAILLYRAAAELDLCDQVLQSSWGGPLNGQTGRQALFRDLIELLKFEIVLETGTFRATTAEWIATQFKVELYTCEINERLFFQAQKKLSDFKNAFIELGDSVAFIKEFISTHPRDSKVLLYLDAHWLDRLPLLEEIELISQHLPRAVVMIDDFEVPGDFGYFSDDYGPGKRIGLNLLQKHYKDCSFFFPTISSEEETGSRRGVAVITWDDEIAVQLAKMTKLRAATETDWAVSRAAAIFQEKVHNLTDLLKGLEADRAARLEQIQTLTTLLQESDTDRAARLEQIQTLTTLLQELDADRAVRLEQIHTLNTLLKESDADRAARLEQIQTLNTLLKESDTGRVAK